MLYEVSIPVIFVGLILLVLTKWVWGLSPFADGGVFLLLERKMECDQPVFFQEQS
jgi:hypothetical protein